MIARRSFSVVGRVENRVSMVAETASPGGAGPGQVGSPTSAGAGWGQGKPLQRRPTVPLSRRVGEGAGVGRGDLDALTLQGRHLLAWHGQDHHVAVGDVHALGATTTNNACKLASLPCLGAVPSTRRGWHGAHHVARHGGGRVDRPSARSSGSRSRPAVASRETSRWSARRTDNTSQSARRWWPPSASASRRKSPKIARFGVLLRSAHYVVAPDRFGRLAGHSDPRPPRQRRPGA